MGVSWGVQCSPGRRRARQSDCLASQVLTFDVLSQWNKILRINYCIVFNHTSCVSENQILSHTAVLMSGVFSFHLQFQWKTDLIYQFAHYLHFLRNAQFILCLLFNVMGWFLTLHMSGFWRAGFWLMCCFAFRETRSYEICALLGDFQFQCSHLIKLVMTALFVGKICLIK